MVFVELNKKNELLNANLCKNYTHITHFLKCGKYLQVSTLGFFLCLCKP